MDIFKVVTVLAMVGSSVIVIANYLASFDVKHTFFGEFAGKMMMTGVGIVSFCSFFMALDI